MKQLFISIIFFALFIASGNAQTEAVLLGNWQDSTLTATSWLDSRYNEVWGVNMNGHEIAIIGSTEGLHFIDVTDPTKPTELKSAFIRGAATGTQLVHRDYHDYKGYLYAVADEGFSTLQVIDMRQLPDTAFLVSNSDQLIQRCHNIFIDSSSATLYACSGAPLDNSQWFNLLSLDISNPEQPAKIASYQNGIDGQPLPPIHDLYVRRDTLYVNGSNAGLFVYDFSDIKNPLLLGSMSTYPDNGYNHSGWLNETGTHYFLADETHGTDLKSVSVTDPADMEVVRLFDADAAADDISIPHNLIAYCDHLYVSYYYDGLQVYDISDPVNPERVAFFDTYLQPDEDFFAGAWGIFPFLESGNILLSDMQTGLYIFQAIDGACESASSVSGSSPRTGVLEVYPNPVATGHTIEIELPNFVTHIEVVRVMDVHGNIVPSNYTTDTGQTMIKLDVNTLAGIYFLEVISDEQKYIAKIMVIQ